MAAVDDGDVLSTDDEHTGASKALEPLKKKAREELVALALTRGLHPVWRDDRGVERLVTLESAITAHVSRMIGISGLPLGLEFKSLEPREQFHEQHRAYLAVQDRLELAVREQEEHDARLSRWQAAGADTLGKLRKHISAYARKKSLDPLRIITFVDEGIVRFKDTNDVLAEIDRTTARVVATNKRIASPKPPPRNWTASAAREPWITAVNVFLQADTHFKREEVPVDGKDTSLLRQSGNPLRVYSLFWMATGLLLPFLDDLTDIARKRATWADIQGSVGTDTVAVFTRIAVLYATIRVLFVESVKIPRSTWITPENTLKREALEHFFADVLSIDYMRFAQAAGAGDTANTFGFTTLAEAGTRLARLNQAPATRRWLRATFSGVEFAALLREALASQPL